MTAVEEFAREHDGDLLGDGPYRSLLPLSTPRPGQQYGFEVDLDACTGCKACVSACRSLNGLDADESWRKVGVLHGVTATSPFQQTVTAACHHCVEPACLLGCPSAAYEKDPITGIVAHLDDQCIGCGYCTLTCPYEVPRMNAARGIVRKCDMCTGRLDEGEAPACAQACPTEAIRIGVVDIVALRAEAAAGHVLVPGAPASSLTIPSTRYITRKPPAEEVRAADHFAVRPAHAHMPLAVMLVLTQLAVGAFSVALLVRGRVRTLDAVLGLLAGALALGASVLHLGRPWQAWRAVIGIRHSWLSREVVAFGAFAASAALYAGGQATSFDPSPVLGWLVAAMGLAGVACSALLYARTRRTWWRMRFTGPRFLATTAIGGLATVLATTVSAASAGGSRALVDEGRRVALALLLVTLVTLAWEASALRWRGRGLDDDLARTALLLRGDLWNWLVARLVLGFVGGVGVPLGLWAALEPGQTPPLIVSLLAVAGLVAVVAAELIERRLFFAAVAAPRMPGGLP